MAGKTSETSFVASLSSQLLVSFIATAATTVPKCGRICRVSETHRLSGPPADVFSGDRACCLQPRPPAVCSPVCCAHLPLDEVILLMPLCCELDFHLDCSWSLCLDFFLLIGYALTSEDLLVIREDEEVLRRSRGYLCSAPRLLPGDEFFHFHRAMQSCKEFHLDFPPSHQRENNT